MFLYTMILGFIVLLDNVYTQETQFSNGYSISVVCLGGFMSVGHNGAACVILFSFFLIMASDNLQWDS